jgi:hypothetical protein
MPASVLSSVNEVAHGYNSGLVIRMLLDSFVYLPEDGGCRVFFRMQRDPIK